MSHTDHGIAAIITSTAYGDNPLIGNIHIHFIYLEFNKIGKSMPSILHHIHSTNTKIRFGVLLNLVHIVRSDGLKLQLCNGRRNSTGLLISVKDIPSPGLILSPIVLDLDYLWLIIPSALGIMQPRRVRILILVS